MEAFSGGIFPTLTAPIDKQIPLPVPPTISMDGRPYAHAVPVPTLPSHTPTAAQEENTAFRLSLDNPQNSYENVCTARCPSSGSSDDSQRQRHSRSTPRHRTKKSQHGVDRSRRRGHTVSPARVGGSAAAVDVGRSERKGSANNLGDDNNASGERHHHHRHRHHRHTRHSDDQGSPRTEPPKESRRRHRYRSNKDTSHAAEQPYGSRSEVGSMDEILRSGRPTMPVNSGVVAGTRRRYSNPVGEPHGSYASEHITVSSSAVPGADMRGSASLSGHAGASGIVTQADDVLSPHHAKHRGHGYHRSKQSQDSPNAEGAAATHPAPSTAKAGVREHRHKRSSHSTRKDKEHHRESVASSVNRLGDSEISSPQSIIPFHHHRSQTQPASSPLQNSSVMGSPQNRRSRRKSRRHDDVDGGSKSVKKHGSDEGSGGHRRRHRHHGGEETANVGVHTSVAEAASTAPEVGPGAAGADPEVEGGAAAPASHATSPATRGPLQWMKKRVNGMIRGTTSGDADDSGEDDRRGKDPKSVETSNAGVSGDPVHQRGSSNLSDASIGSESHHRDHEKGNSMKSLFTGPRKLLGLFGSSERGPKKESQDDAMGSVCDEGREKSLSSMGESRRGKNTRKDSKGGGAKTSEAPPPPSAALVSDTPTLVGFESGLQIVTGAPMAPSSNGMDKLSPSKSMRSGASDDNRTAAEKGKPSKKFGGELLSGLGKKFKLHGTSSGKTKEKGGALGPEVGDAVSRSAESESTAGDPAVAAGAIDPEGSRVDRSKRDRAKGEKAVEVTPTGEETPLAVSASAKQLELQLKEQLKAVREQRRKDEKEQKRMRKADKKRAKEVKRKKRKGSVSSSSDTSSGAATADAVEAEVSAEVPVEQPAPLPVEPSLETTSVCSSSSENGVGASAASGGGAGATLMTTASPYLMVPHVNPPQEIVHATAYAPYSLVAPHPGLVASEDPSLLASAGCYPSMRPIERAPRRLDQDEVRQRASHEQSSLSSSLVGNRSARPNSLFFDPP